MALPSAGRAAPPEAEATVEAGLVGAVAMAGCAVALVVTEATLAGLAAGVAVVYGLLLWRWAARARLGLLPS